MHDPTSAALDRLQGVWFPIRHSVEGRLRGVNEPSFPPPSTVAALTIQGEYFHVTAAAEYHYAGGRLRLSGGPSTGELVFEYVIVPEEFWTSALYHVAGDELSLWCDGPTPTRRLNVAFATHYRRVAATPTAEMAALIEQYTRWWMWAGRG
jgi:hypothetical protein